MLPSDRLYSGLLFLFPAAAWVNLAPNLLGQPTLTSTLLACLMFLFLPVEFFSSHLWAMSEKLATKSAMENVLRRVLVDLLDLARVLSLTIAYAVAPSLILAAAPTADDTLRVALFWAAFGGFLIFNLLWNLAMSPVHGEAMVQFTRATVASENKSGEPLTDKIVEVFYFLTLGTQAFTKTIFYWIFPLVGALALTFAVAVGLSSADFLFGLETEIVTASAGIFCCILFAQVVTKAGQISALSVLNSAVKRKTQQHEERLANAAVAAQVSITPASTPQMNAPAGFPFCARVLTMAPHLGSRVTEATADIREIFRFRAEAYSRDTRRTYPGIDALIFDDWDFRGTHFVVRDEDEIVAVARICEALDKRLPVSDELSGLDVRDGDLELGRMLVRADKRKGPAAAVIFAALAMELDRAPNARLYADALSGGLDVFKEKRLLRMGFAHVGPTYQDSALRFGKQDLHVEQ